METYKGKGIYEEGTIYVLKNMEDWDELEILYRKGNPVYPNQDSPFFYLKGEFEKFIGKLWQDKNQTKYKVMGIEKNDPMRDWYWIVQNVDDDRDIKYILANSKDLKNGIIL